MATSSGRRSERRRSTPRYVERSLDHDALVATALRTRSVWSRELLAELAWPGHTLSDLIGFVSSGRGGLPASASAVWVSRLGYVLALQDVEPTDRPHGRALLESAVRELGVDALPERPAEVLAELRMLDGDLAGTIEVLDAGVMRSDVASGVRVDLLNPTRSQTDTMSAWLSQLNTFLHGDRVAPIELASPAAGTSPFDRLTARSPRTVTSPIRITVAMSTYRPTQALVTAARSVLRQSWANLELLVVDDASGSQYEPLLRKIEEMDPRARVIRKAVNGGTYRARNTALRQARGDVFTILDSDDWMHPQALERSIQPLLDSPDVIATRHMGVRIQDDLLITRMGYHARYVGAHSLMFRLSEVVDRIGFFDPARKGADTEYAGRLEAAFHRKIVDIREVLSLHRAGETLSSAEFAPRWRHGSRFGYKCLYAPWHTRIASMAADPFLDDTAPRRFPEPLRWSRPLSATISSQRRFDVCIAGDWRAHAGPHSAMFDQIAAATQAGMSVAVMHLERFRFMSRHDLSLCDPVLTLLLEGAVRLVQPDDDVDIDVLLVHGADTLLYPPHVPDPARVGTTVVVADEAPRESESPGLVYAVADVSDRAQRTFGAPVLWAPQSPHVRAALREHGLADQLVTWDATELVEVPDVPLRAQLGHDEIVVGQYVHDSGAAFGTTHQELVDAYDFGAGHRVRFLGGTMRIKRMAGGEGAAGALPPNWELVPQAHLEPREFYAGLDFFVHYDAPGRLTAFDRTLIEAAARGVITVTDAGHEDALGDLVDYAAPGAARELVAAYVADPARYAERSAQIRTLAAERFGYDAFVAHVRSLKRRDDSAGARAVTARARAHTPIRLEVQDRGSRQRLQIRVDQGLEAIQVPLRTAADAAAMDELALIVRERTCELTTWAQRQLPDDVTPTFDPAALTSAPEAVVCGAYRDGSALYLLAREGWTLDVGDQLAPVGPFAQGWSTWRLGTGRTDLTLRPPR